MIEIYDKKFSELQQEAQHVSSLLAEAAEQKKKIEAQMQSYNTHLLKLDGAMIAVNELKQEALVAQQQKEAETAEQAVKEEAPAE